MQNPEKDLISFWSNPKEENSKTTTSLDEVLPEKELEFFFKEIKLITKLNKKESVIYNAILRNAEITNETRSLGQSLPETVFFQALTKCNADSIFMIQYALKNEKEIIDQIYRFKSIEAIPLVHAVALEDVDQKHQLEIIALLLLSGADATKQFKIGSDNKNTMDLIELCKSYGISDDIKSFIYLGFFEHNLQNNELEKAQSFLRLSYESNQNNFNYYKSLLTVHDRGFKLANAEQIINAKNFIEKFEKSLPRDDEQKTNYSWTIQGSRY